MEERNFGRTKNELSGGRCRAGGVLQRGGVITDALLPDSDQLQRRAVAGLTYLKAAGFDLSIDFSLSSKNRTS